MKSKFMESFQILLLKGLIIISDKHKKTGKFFWKIKLNYLGLA